MGHADDGRHIVLWLLWGHSGTIVIGMEKPRHTVTADGDVDMTTTQVGNNATVVMLIIKNGMTPDTVKERCDHDK